jgi:hypothetical protein
VIEIKLTAEQLIILRDALAEYLEKTDAKQYPKCHRDALDLLRLIRSELNKK